MHLRTEVPTPWQSGRPCRRQKRAFAASAALHKYTGRPRVCSAVAGGYLRQSSWAKGEWTDDLLYALLQEEWQTGRG